MTQTNSNTDEPTQDQRKKRRWPIILLAIVGACIILAILGALLSDGDSEEPVATEPPTEIAAGPTEEPEATTPPQTDTPEQPTDAPAPTDTPLPTETPIPTDTPLPTEPPEPTATEPPAVTIVSATGYASEYGIYYVAGEVRNNSESALDYVEIVGTFYDDQNQVVDTTFTYTMLDIVDAGGLAPFELSLLDPPDTLSSYKLDVQYNETWDDPLRVTVTSHRGSLSEYGIYSVVGEVENPYDFPIEYVMIAATFYDSAGNVVRAGYTYTNLDILQAGQSSPFDLSILDPPPELDHYELQTQARKQ